MNTKDYRNAPSGKGPHAFNWKDKPHRLIYDLANEVDRLKRLLVKHGIDSDPALCLDGKEIHHEK